jgi:hypothetical protein
VALERSENCEFSRGECVSSLVDVRSPNLRAALFAALHKDLRLAAQNEATRLCIA